MILIWKGSRFCFCCLWHWSYLTGVIINFPKRERGVGESAARDGKGRRAEHLWSMLGMQNFEFSKENLDIFRITWLTSETLSSIFVLMLWTNRQTFSSYFVRKGSPLNYEQTSRMLFTEHTNHRIHHKATCQVKYDPSSFPSSKHIWRARIQSSHTMHHINCSRMVKKSFLAKTEQDGFPEKDKHLAWQSFIVQLEILYLFWHSIAPWTMLVCATIKYVRICAYPAYQCI